MRSPLPSILCLNSNSRLALHYRFGLRNKDTMSLGCVALVHPTLLMFIEYYSNTYMDITSSTYGIYPRVMPHLRGQLLTGDARCVHWPAFTSTVCLVTRHSRDVVATHCGGGVTLTASN